jgi:hypothetical protein
MNVMRALDYACLGKSEEALVESRKVESFLDELNRHLGGRQTYKDDAFARYLDALLYSDRGDMDDTRISKEASDAAYARYKTDYGTPLPDFHLSLDPPQKNGELVFIHYNGPPPRKVQESYTLAWPRIVEMIDQSNDENSKTQLKEALGPLLPTNTLTFAEPKYVPAAFSIKGSQMIVDDHYGTKTVLAEDVSAIAAKTLADRMSAIRTRAIARAAIKSIITAKAIDLCKAKLPAGDFNGVLCSTVGSLAGATELADTRSWSTLPSQIRLARLRLPPGRHDVKIEFLDQSGAVLSTYEFKNVLIEKAKRTYLHYRTAS